MADMYGRLTGRAGVCLGTLGPGATNLVTAVADAYLDRAPLVALTGQGDLERMHKESHQYIDIVDVMRPITKWNARVNSPEIIPEVVRKAFKVAESEKPGATHIELPEDVMAMESTRSRCRAAAGQARAGRARAAPRRRPHPQRDQPGRARRQRRRARRRPRPRCASSRRATGIPVAETFMGKGVMDYEDPKSLGTVGLQSRDYALAGLRGRRPRDRDRLRPRRARAEHWNPGATRRSSSSTRSRPRSTSSSQPEVELVGDIYHVLTRLAEECRDVPHPGGSHRLREVVMRRFEAAKDDDHFPMQPPRALWEIRKAMGREDILISDVGLHKLWIARMFPAHEPNTVLIANGLAGMGFALPCGDRGQARPPRAQGRHGQRRRRLPHERAGARDRDAARDADVNIVWENRQYGSIVWKQDKKFGRHFGVDFTNPDFVKLADAFGMPAWRCESVRTSASTCAGRWAWTSRRSSCSRSTTRSTSRSPRSSEPRRSRPGQVLTANR